MAGERIFKLDEYSVRLTRKPLYSEKEICSQQEAVEFLMCDMADRDREVVCILMVNTKGQPIGVHYASVGSLRNSIVHPREIMKCAILSNAAGMIIMHNHPSGNVTPSEQDVLTTNRMLDVCSLMGIPLIDHIIVGSGVNYYSFRDDRNYLFSEVRSTYCTRKHVVDKLRRQDTGLMVAEK